MMAVAAMALMTACHDKKQTAENIVTVKTATAAVAGATAGQQNYAGSIEEQSGALLSFATAGTIKALSVHEGQNVSAGQLIGIVDATANGNAAEMARATTQQARQTLAQAQDAYNRMKQLHDNGSLPEIKWVEVQTKLDQARQMLSQAQAAERIARKGVADTRLTAPFSGYIASKTADVGQNIVPGQAVVNLVKIDQVKVKVSVPEDEIGQMRMGQRIMFRVASLGSTTFWGTVTEKSVTADPISRQYTVKALVPNPGHHLLPGMVCDVYATVGEAAEGIALPANLIQIDIDNQPFVWTVAQGKAHRVKVVLGANVGENVIVKSGLQPGDKVIVEGQQKVSEGMKVIGDR
jgi:RND family efflux transporter MFP subunit